MNDGTDKSGMNLARLVIGLLAATALAGALAQTTAPTTTDVQPAPAESRSSSGAVELERSPVPAKRDGAAGAAARSMDAAPAATGTPPTVATPRSDREERRAKRAEKRAADAAQRSNRAPGNVNQN